MASNLKLVSTLTVGDNVTELSWTGKNQKELVRFEHACTAIMAKMNRLAQDMADGRIATPTGAGVDVTWTKAAFRADGSVYARETTEWPGFPADFTDAFKGILAGELGGLEKDANKVKRHK